MFVGKLHPLNLLIEAERKKEAEPLSLSASCIHLIALYTMLGKIGSNSGRFKSPCFYFEAKSFITYFDFGAECLIIRSQSLFLTISEL